jgi:hypothetical protein
MARLQLALNVSNLDEAVNFYSKFFNTEPTKVRHGYANFAIAEPPLKLVLFENPDAGGTINHLGVEVFSTEEVVAATTALKQHGFEVDVEEQTTCCFAVQDKVWVNGPDASRWEVYTVLAHDDETVVDEVGGSCCSSEPGDGALSVKTAPSTCC